MSFALADPARAAWAAGLAVAGAGLGILAGIDARLAVGLALGVAFVLIALTSVTLGLCLFIALEFLQLSGLGLSVEKMAGGLLALSWLGAMALRRGEAERSLISAHPAFTGLLAFFVGWSLLSALWAAAPDVALASGLRYAQTAVFFLIVYTAVHTRQQALWVVGAFVLSAGLAATLGLVLPSEVSDEGRLEGTYGEPNEYATYLVVGLVLAVTLAGVRAVSAPLRLAAIAAGSSARGPFSSRALARASSRWASLCSWAFSSAVDAVSGRWWPSCSWQRSRPPTSSVSPPRGNPAEGLHHGELGPDRPLENCRTDGGGTSRARRRSGQLSRVVHRLSDPARRDPPR